MTQPSCSRLCGPTQCIVPTLLIPQTTSFTMSLSHRLTVPVTDFYFFYIHLNPNRNPVIDQVNEVLNGL